MLVFIIPLWHHEACESYKNVCSLLEHTLKSICNQKNSDFQVIVVCNKIPEIEFNHRSIHFLEVDFPPGLPRTAVWEKKLESLRIDKGCKIFSGLLYARQFDPNFVMFVDGDDYISNRLAGFVNKKPESNGWYFDRGYKYRASSPFLTPINKFYKLCGTSSILKFNHLDVPGDISPGLSRDQIMERVDNNFLRRILGEHNITPQYFEKKGVPLHPLPFVGAFYVLHNSENHSGNPAPLGWLPVSRKIAAEFALPSTFWPLFIAVLRRKIGLMSTNPTHPL